MLPAKSATAPLASCAPSLENVCGAGTVAGFTPEPVLPSLSAGSPLAANETVTESLYQPPSPAKSGARSAPAVGALGAVSSTTTALEAADGVDSLPSADAITRYVHVPSPSAAPAVNAYSALVSPLATVLQPPFEFSCCSVYVRPGRNGDASQFSENTPLLFGVEPLESCGAPGVAGAASVTVKTRPRSFCR